MGFGTQYEATNLDERIYLDNTGIILPLHYIRVCVHHFTFESSIQLITNTVQL